MKPYLLILFIDFFFNKFLQIQASTQIVPLRNNHIVNNKEKIVNLIKPKKRLLYDQNTQYSQCQLAIQQLGKNNCWARLSDQQQGKGDWGTSYSCGQVDSICDSLYYCSSNVQSPILQQFTCPVNQVKCPTATNSIISLTDLNSVNSYVNTQFNWNLLSSEQVQCKYKFQYSFSQQGSVQYDLKINISQAQNLNSLYLIRVPTGDGWGDNVANFQLKQGNSITIQNVGIGEEVWIMYFPLIFTKGSIQIISWIVQNQQSNQIPIINTYQNQSQANQQNLSNSTNQQSSQNQNQGQQTQNNQNLSNNQLNLQTNQTNQKPENSSLTQLPQNSSSNQQINNQSSQTQINNITTIQPQNSSSIQLNNNISQPLQNISQNSSSIQNNSLPNQTSKNISGSLIDNSSFQLNQSQNIQYNQQNITSLQTINNSIPINSTIPPHIQQLSNQSSNEATSIQNITSQNTNTSQESSQLPLKHSNQSSNSSLINSSPISNSNISQSIIQPNISNPFQQNQTSIDYQNNQNETSTNSSQAIVNSSDTHLSNNVTVIAIGIVVSSIFLIIFIGICLQCRKSKQVVLQEDQESSPILEKKWESQTKFPLNSLDLKNPNSDITQDEKLLNHAINNDNYKSQVLEQNYHTQKQVSNENFSNKKVQETTEKINFDLIDIEKRKQEQTDHKLPKNDVNSESDINYSDHLSSDKYQQIKLKMEKQKEIYRKVKKWKKNDELVKKKAPEEDSQYILKTLPSSLKLQNKLQQINEETSEEMMSQIKINESCQNSIQFQNSEQGGIKTDQDNLIQELVIEESLNNQKEQIVNLGSDTPYKDEQFTQLQPFKSIQLRTLQVQDRNPKMESEDQETANYNDGQDMDLFNQKHQTIDKSQKSKSRKREASAILEIQRKSEMIENQNSQIKSIIEQSLASMQKVEGLFKRVEEDLQSPKIIENSNLYNVNSDNLSESDEYIKDLINQKKEIQIKMIETQSAFNKKNSQDSQLQEKDKNFDEVNAYRIVQKEGPYDINIINENQIKDNSQNQLRVTKKKKKKKVAKKFIQQNTNQNDQIDSENPIDVLDQEQIKLNQQNYQEQDLSQNKDQLNKIQKKDQEKPNISITENQNQKANQEYFYISKPISSTINRSNTLSMHKFQTPKKLELSQILIDSQRQIDKGTTLIQKTLRDQQNRYLSNYKSKEILDKNQDLNNSYIFPQILNKSTSSLKTFKNINAQNYEAKQYNETSQYFNKQISKQNKFSVIDNSIHQSNKSLDFKSLYQQNQTQQDNYDIYFNKNTSQNSINNQEQSSIGITGRQSQIPQNLEESFIQKSSYQDLRQPRFYQQKKLRYPEQNEQTNMSNYVDEAQQISPGTKKQSNQKQIKGILNSKILMREQNSLNNSMQMEDNHMKISDFNQNRFIQMQDKRASTQIEKQTPNFAKNSFVNLQQISQDKKKINEKINQQRSIFATAKKNKLNYMLPHQLSEGKKSRDDKSLNFYQDSKNNQSSLGSYQIQKEESSQEREKKEEIDQKWNSQNKQMDSMHQQQNKTLNNFKKNPSQNSLLNNMQSRQSLKLQNQIINNSKENNQMYIEKDEIEQQGGIKMLIKPKQKESVMKSQKVMNGQFNKTGFNMKGNINDVKKINLAKVGNLIQDQMNDAQNVDKL